MLDSKGCHTCKSEELHAIPLPPATETFVPVNHGVFYDLVLERLGWHGFDVTDQQLALSKEDQRFFGLFHVNHTKRGSYQSADKSQYSTVIGIRSAFDKSMAAGIAVGSNVLVCSNMCFSGEIVFNRKHTRYILQELPLIIDTALEQIPTMASQMDEDITALSRVTLSTAEADHVMMRSILEGVFPASYIGDVASEWRKPFHEEFTPRNAWSLLNAFTYVNQDRRRGVAALHTAYDIQPWMLETVETLPASRN